MQPQGSSIVNTAYFDAAIATVNAIPTCADLTKFALDELVSLAATKDGINAQLADLEPLLALLTIPTNPAQLLTWASNFITSYLAPQLAPYTTYTAQLIAYEAQIARLVAAITAKAASIPNCTISLPSI